MQIPKIIHLIEPSEQVFHLWKELHPDWQCYEWSIDQCSHFIRKFYPEFIAIYDAYTHPLQKVRASWIFLLHRYGGVAIDTKLIPKKRMVPLFYTPHSFYLIDKMMIASPPKSRMLDDWIYFMSHNRGNFWMKITGSLVDKTTWMEKRDSKDTIIKLLPERIWRQIFYHNEDISFFKVLGWKPIVLCIVACALSYFVFSKKKKKQPVFEDVSHLYTKKSTISTMSVTPTLPSEHTGTLTVESTNTRETEFPSLDTVLGQPVRNTIELESQYHPLHMQDLLDRLSLSSLSKDSSPSMSRISSLSSLHSAHSYRSNLSEIILDTVAPSVSIGQIVLED